MPEATNVGTVLIALVAIMQAAALAKSLFWKENRKDEYVSREEFEAHEAKHDADIARLEKAHHTEIGTLTRSMNDLRVEITRLATLIEHGLFRRDKNDSD